MVRELLDRAIGAALRPLELRIINMMARAVVRKADDATRAQTLQCSMYAGEVADGVERFQNYGLTSLPFDGAEALVVHLGGNRDHAIAVVVEDRRHRPGDLEPGEVCLYDDRSQRVHLRRDEIRVLTDQVVRIGRTEPGTYESVMLFPDCNADLGQIQTKFNLLATEVNAALAKMEAKFSTAKPGSPGDQVGGSGYAPVTAALALTQGTRAANLEAEK